jgi:hypothetical protein
VLHISEHNCNFSRKNISEKFFVRLFENQGSRKFSFKNFVVELIGTIRDA